MIFTLFIFTVQNILVVIRWTFRSKSSADSV